MERLSTRRTRYQSGSLYSKQSAQGLCWFVRFRHTDETGQLQRPAFRVGLVRDLPTRSKAMRAAEDIRREFNSPAARQQEGRRFGELIDRYVREEMPERYTTAKGYRNILENHIRPKWGDRQLEEVTSRAVRDWLRMLQVSTKSRGHIRDMLRTLFRFAMFWEWIPVTENPMSLFKLERSTLRAKQPRILTVEQFQKLRDAVDREPHRTMLILVAGLGLRRSELIALQWQDVNWIHNTLTICRSMVDGHEGNVKTEHSGRPLPLHPSLAALLSSQRERSTFKEDTDWIFASPHTAGERPMQPDRILQKTIQPAAMRVGLGAGIGWHTFRHSYRAWLDQAGAPIGVQRDLLRHADVGTTMNIYGGSFVDSLREANDVVVNRVIQ